MMYGSLNGVSVVPLIPLGPLVPTAIDAGLGDTVLGPQATGMPEPVWLALTILCGLVAIFALLMSAGAAWRALPPSWRRRQQDVKP